MSTVLERMILKKWAEKQPNAFKNNPDKLPETVVFSKKEDRSKMVKCPMITIDFIIKYERCIFNTCGSIRDGSYKAFYSRKDLTWEVVEKYGDGYEWNWQYLCKYNGRTFNRQSFIDRIDWLMNYRSPKWDSNSTICHNKPVARSNMIKWINYVQSANPYLDLSVVEEDPDNGWYWHGNGLGLSDNPVVTWGFIEKFQDKSWAIESLYDVSVEEPTQESEPIIDLLTFDEPSSCIDI